MNSVSIRCVTEADAPLLRFLANTCHPLDVHTPYTYWVVCHYHGQCSFVMEQDGNPIGYLMAVQMPDCLFIWQIGLTEPFRGKGLSALLIAKAALYAADRGLPMQVSIAAENSASNAAFRSYCRDHGMALEPIGQIGLHDLLDPAFQESEVLYRMTKKG